MLQDFDDELRSVESFKYELPDGNQFFIKDERIKCTESFFNENNFLEEFDFINQNYHHSYDEMFYCLSGGNSMLKGFHERIEQIAKKIKCEDLKVISRRERKFSAWRAGSILATLDKYFTKKQYEMNPQEFYVSDLIF